MAKRPLATVIPSRTPESERRCVGTWRRTNGRALRFLVQRDRRNLIPALIAMLLTLLDEEDRLFDALQCLARTTVPRDWKAWNEWEEENVGILSRARLSQGVMSSTNGANESPQLVDLLID